MKGPRTLPWLTCALSLSGFVAVPSSMKAQKPMELDRIIEFSTPFTQAHSKFIHEGVTDQDPGALVWIDTSLQEVLLRVHVELDRDQLQQVLGQAGLTITYLGHPRHEVGSIRAAAPGGGGTKPVYVDTGDPATDNVRYELRKKNWIAVHPEEYLEAPTDPE